MEFRKKLSEWTRAATPAAMALALAAACAAIVWLLPGRAAALLLGAIAAIALGFGLLRQAQRATQIAILWALAAISADAAYAKLNDQPSVTLANGVMKIADGVVKLADATLKGTGALPPDMRARIAAVTPDFVWALILVLVLVMAFMLSRPAPAPGQTSASMRR